MQSVFFEFREVDRDRFEEVRSGVKEIETRAGKEKYESIQVGDEVTFKCGNDTFTRRVAKKYHWRSVENMAAEVSLRRVMPDLKTIEEAKLRYASYPDYSELIEKYGILGFELSN